MLVNQKPILPSHYTFLPMSGAVRLVDFWSSWYIKSTEEDLTAFSRRAAAYMTALGYAGDTDGSADFVSFSGGVIGVGREMLRYHTPRAVVTLYFKPIQDYYYVSLRMAYYQAFSLLKILCFALVVCGLTLFWGIQAVPVWYRSYEVSGLFIPSDPQEFYYWSKFVLSGYYLSNTIDLGVFVTIGMLGLCGFISWWRTGHVFQFLRQDFHEVYRDDVMSIGQAAYHAINQAADDLSLQAVGLPAQQPLPLAPRSRRI